MIQIDGSSSGGQIVRLAVALAALTGKAIKIINIRGARPQAGLKTQHIEGIRAIGKLCDAEIKGLTLGSTTLEFYPKDFEEKDLEIEISTAGSIGLVLQTLLIVTPKLRKPINIKIAGGSTFSKWAPPVVYLERILFPLLSYDSELEILKEGFYPKGSAEVVATLKPMKIKPIDFTERTEIKSLSLISVASKSLEKSRVAERQADAAQKLLEEKLNKTPFIEIKYSEALSPGSGVLAVLQTHNSILGADLLGERGKPSEYIGERVVRDLIREYSKGVIDRHAADMLLPYMAMSKGSKIISSDITHHIITSAEVIEKFLDVKFEINRDNNTISV
jgi:RNA 3'-phosphate cyclase